MKKFFPVLFAGILGFSSLAMAHGQGDGAEPAGLEDLETLWAGAFSQFRADIRTEEGREVGDEVLGFQWSRQQDEAVLDIYEVKSNGQLGTEVYDCHLHDSSAHCNYLESRPPVAYNAPARPYKIEELLEGAKQSLILLDGRVDNLADVTSLKIWQDGREMQVRVQGTKTSYLSCHYHGAGIDCHRQRNVGANEP